MKGMKLVTLLIVSLWVTSGSASARGWRGIVPLHSTCEDVRRLLGHTTCKAESYDLENESVFIVFSKGNCNGVGNRWNVPAGTVLTIEITPKVKPRLSDFIKDQSRYTQTEDQHLAGVVYYTDKEEGLTLQAFSNGEVGSISYGPATKDSALRCPDTALSGNSKNLPEGLLKFDEYGKLPYRKEKVRLAYFSRQLRLQPGAKEYIVVHSLRGREKDGRASAARARNYLVKRQRLPAKRIVVIEGDQWKTLTIELYIGPPNHLVNNR